MLDILEIKPEIPNRDVGHVQRKDSEYVGRRTLRVEVPGRRSRGSPKT